MRASSTTLCVATPRAATDRPRAGDRRLSQLDRLVQLVQPVHVPVKQAVPVILVVPIIGCELQTSRARSP